MVERYERRHDGDRREDQRGPGQRDRDRILYTSAFRRLGGITQVAAPSEPSPVHNRLTHSLEVAQIGRRLSEKLCADAIERGIDAANLDPDVVEAAALAHDLGHPPFGHIAEDELDQLVRDASGGQDFEGFGGNAQSFRIVTQLAVRHERFPGLNLTAATLDAILKYPTYRGTTGTRQRKWGAYHSEAEDFHFARGLHPAGDESRSLEAQIMDWADDVAYAVHDMEDFFRAGFIPLDQLRTSSREAQRFLDRFFDRHAGELPLRRNEMEDRFAGMMRNFPVSLDGPFQSLRRDRSNLRSVTSYLIMRYILEAVSIDMSQTGGTDLALSIGPEYVAEVMMLKDLTRHYVIDRAALATQQHGQRRVIRDLFEVLYDAALTTDGSRRAILPLKCREQLVAAPLSDAWCARVVADHMSSMTEAECLDLRCRLWGYDLGSVLDPMH